MALDYCGVLLQTSSSLPVDVDADTLEISMELWAIGDTEAAIAVSTIVSSKLNITPYWNINVNCMFCSDLYLFINNIHINKSIRNYIS